MSLKFVILFLSFMRYGCLCGPVGQTSDKYQTIIILSCLVTPLQGYMTKVFSFFKLSSVHAHAHTCKYTYSPLYKGYLLVWQLFVNYVPFLTFLQSRISFDLYLSLYYFTSIDLYLCFTIQINQSSTCLIRRERGNLYIIKFHMFQTKDTRRGELPLFSFFGRTSLLVLFCFIWEDHLCLTVVNGFSFCLSESQKQQWLQLV